jgi:hypothetical protein
MTRVTSFAQTIKYKHIFSGVKYQMPNLKRAIPFWGVNNRVGGYQRNYAATFVFSSMLGLGGALTAIYFTGGFKTAIQEEEDAYQFHNGLHHAAAGLVVGAAASVFFLIGCGPACCLTRKLNKVAHTKARLKAQLATVAVSAASDDVLGASSGSSGGFSGDFAAVAAADRGLGGHRSRRRAALRSDDGGSNDDSSEEEHSADTGNPLLRGTYGTMDGSTAVVAVAHAADASASLLATSGPASRQGGISVGQRVFPFCLGFCVMALFIGVPVALLATHDDLSKDWEAMTKWPSVHWLGVGIFSLLSTAVVGAMGVATHACTGAMFCARPTADFDPYGDMYDSLSSSDDDDRIDLVDARAIHNLNSDS